MQVLATTAKGPELMAAVRSTLICFTVAVFLTQTSSITCFGQVDLRAETSLIPANTLLSPQDPSTQNRLPVEPPQEGSIVESTESANSFLRIPSREECAQWFKRDEASPSWQARPFSTGYSIGAMQGDHLVQGRLDQGTGLMFSKRYGWDFAEHWGMEARIGEATLPIIDRTGQMRTHSSHVLMADVSLLIYPLGDTRLRPFFTVGGGLVNFNYDDIDGRKKILLGGLPAGVGCKYYWNEHLALRIDAQDNLAFGAHGLSSTTNVSLTVGAEIRFGDLGNLWPWHKRQSK